MSSRLSPRVSILVISMVAALAAGCGSKSDSKAPGAAKPGDAKSAAGGGDKPKGLPVKAQPVTVGEVQSDLAAVGSLMASESVLIRPEIAGRVIGLHFQEGRPVHKGDKMVSIDASEYQAQLAASSADARTEMQKYQRSRELLEQKFISQEAVDVARGSMERAIAKRQADEAMLAKTTIKAPFTGTVALRLISPGAYVKAGDDIVRIESTGTLKLDFRVPEVFVSKLKQGQTVSMRTDAFPGETFTGRIYALDPAVDEKTRTILARAEVPNAEGKLRPGMFGRVNILLESRPTAITVPEQAIWPQGRDTFVYRAVDGKAILTKIKIGVRRPGRVEVIEGLSPNDIVVTDGQMKLKDGAPVMVLPMTPPAPAPGAQAATPAKAGS